MVGTKVLILIEVFCKRKIMHIIEIILWIVGSLSALLALGKIMHAKKCKNKNVCACCGQPLATQKHETNKEL